VTRGSRLLAVLLAIVVVSAALPTAAMSSHSRARAEVSKKKRKCKKGYKRVRVHGKVRCKKRRAGSGTTGSGTTESPPPAPSPDPQTRFLAMFNNSGWDRGWTADTPQHEPFEDLYNFCGGGRYYERFTNGFTGYDSPYQGSWQLLGVQTGTVGGYNVVEGHLVTTDQSSSQTQLYVDLSEQVPNMAFINQNEFTRIAPQAC
jgi:hypothetical protein